MDDQDEPLTEEDRQDLEDALQAQKEANETGSWIPFEEVLKEHGLTSRHNRPKDNS